MARLLVVGDIHFVDENGFETDEIEIVKVDKVIPLKDGDDADEIGEQYLSKGHSSYTTLEGLIAIDDFLLNEITITQEERENIIEGFLL